MTAGQIYLTQRALDSALSVMNDEPVGFGIIEKGRWQFDTYEQALEIISSLESKGYEAADGATESIKYLLDVQSQYAASAQTGGESESEGA